MPKGKKTCPKCQASAGPAARTCKQCGAAFTVKAAAAPAVKTVPVVATVPVEATPLTFRFAEDGAIQETILTPAGACPIRFTGDLQSWVGDLLSRDNYGPSALKYWLRKEVSQEEFKQFAPQVEQLCQG